MKPTCEHCEFDDKHGFEIPCRGCVSMCNFKLGVNVIKNIDQDIYDFQCLREKLIEMSKKKPNDTCPAGCVGNNFPLPEELKEPTKINPEDDLPG